MVPAQIIAWFLARPSQPYGDTLDILHTVPCYLLWWWWEGAIYCYITVCFALVGVFLHSANLLGTCFVQGSCLTNLTSWWSLWAFHLFVLCRNIRNIWSTLSVSQMSTKLSQSWVKIVAIILEALCSCQTLWLQHHEPEQLSCLFWQGAACEYPNHVHRHCSSRLCTPQLAWPPTAPAHVGVQWPVADANPRYKGEVIFLGWVWYFALPVSFHILHHVGRLWHCWCSQSSGDMTWQFRHLLCRGLLHYRIWLFSLSYLTFPDYFNTSYTVVPCLCDPSVEQFPLLWDCQTLVLGLTFSISIPLMTDHPSDVTTLSWQKGWSHRDAPLY